MRQTWEKIFPIHSIENNYLIGGSGEITIGYKLLLPEIFTLSISQYNDINNEYIKLLELLPPNTVVHKQDYFFSNSQNNDHSYTNDYVELENKRHFFEKDILIHYSNLYITFKELPNIKNPSNTPFLKRLSFPNQKRNKDIDKYYKAISIIIDNINNYIDNCVYINATRMDNTQLSNCLYDYYSLQYDNINKNYNDYLPPLHFNNELQIGENYVKILSLTEQADVVSTCDINKTLHSNNEKIKMPSNLRFETSYVYPLGIGLPINHILNTIVTIKDIDQLNTELEISKRELNVTKNFSINARNKYNSVITFQENISKYGYKPVSLSVNIIINSYSKEILNDYLGICKTAFTNINSKSFTENEDTANLFIANGPGAGQYNYRTFLTISHIASCYFHKETHYLSDNEGHKFCDRFGNPKIIKLWDSKYIINRNMLIIGPAGSGKSFANNNICNQFLYNNHHVVIIDIGHSYKRNCELNNGKYFNSSELKTMSFNPFLYAEKDSEGNFQLFSLDDTEETGSSIINTIYTIIITIWKPSEKENNNEKIIIKQLIEQFYNYVNKNKIFPNLIEFYNFIEIFRENNKYNRFIDYESLLLSLHSYCFGNNKNLLNGKNNIDITNDKFIVFDLESIQQNKELFNIISVIIIELVLQKCDKLPGIKKTFMIDEALDFLTDEKFGDFIAQLFRKIRKKEGQVGIATQNASFFDNIPTIIRNSIIINSDIKIILDHSSQKSSYNDLQRLLSFTDNDIKLLESIQNGENYREFLLKLGNKSFIYRNEVSEFAQCIYTSKQKEVIEIEKLIKEKGDLVPGIYQYLENKKRKLNL